MAGDWIKMQHATPDKPEVMKMAKLLGVEPEQVVGHLVRVWSWTDQQSLDGHALDVTEIDVDRVARHADVAKAMREVGWLKGQDGRLSFPNFDRHNGESAKKRALAADRKRVERSRSQRDEEVTRGEERRELHTSPLGTPPAASTNQDQRQLQTKAQGQRLAAFLGVDEQSEVMYASMPSAWMTWALGERPDLEGSLAWAKFCDHWKAQTGRHGVKADWEATWRNWIRREPRGRNSGQSALEAKNRENLAGWKPPEEVVP